MTAKAQTEEDRCIQKLIEFRNAAEVANGNAQELLRGWAKKPRYAVSSRSETVARAQKRARAKKDLSAASHRIRRIGTACDHGDELAVECLPLVKGAAITLKFPAIHVGVESFPTAHEAAFALGELALEMWDVVGGDDELEIAPNRLDAEGDSPDGDAARRMRQRLWKRSLKELNRVPRDLWGQIQQEFLATRNRYFHDDAEAVEVDNDSVAVAAEPQSRATVKSSKIDRSVTLTEAHLRSLRTLKKLKAFGPDSRQTHNEIAATIDSEWCREHIAEEMAQLARLGLVDSLRGRPPKGTRGGSFITKNGLAELAKHSKRNRVSRPASKAKQQK